MKQLLLILLISLSVLYCMGQPVSGTTGVLNIPSAEMQRDGTFCMGANYLPESFTPSSFSYDTWNYYFNITFVPFLEVTYRMTLFKLNMQGTQNSPGRFNEQDRSFGLRARLWKEGRYLPAVVVGGNDLYTSTEGKGNQYFGATYAVASKSIYLDHHRFVLTLGSGLRVIEQKQLSGFFGGISYTPGFLKQVSLMADYDDKSVNLGASALLFNHLHLHAFLNDYSNLVAGFGYRIYLGRKKG